MKEQIKMVREQSNLLQSTNTGNKHFLTYSNRKVSDQTLEAYILELKTVFASFRRRAQFDEEFLSEDKLLQVSWSTSLFLRQNPLEKYLLESD